MSIRSAAQIRSVAGICVRVRVVARCATCHPAMVTLSLRPAEGRRPRVCSDDM